jgi:hypothetical protein
MAFRRGPLGDYDPSTSLAVRAMAVDEARIVVAAIKAINACFMVGSPSYSSLFIAYD